MSNRLITPEVRRRANRTALLVAVLLAVGLALFTYLAARKHANRPPEELCRDDGDGVCTIVATRRCRGSGQGWRCTPWVPVAGAQEEDE